MTTKKKTTVKPEDLEEEIEGEEEQETDADEGQADDEEDVDGGEEGDEDGSDDDQQDPDIDEAKLRKMGWVPKAEWKGDPDNWMDPKTFQKKRTDELSMLRAANREMRETIDDFKEFSKTRDERAYKRALAELKAKKTAAVADGDVDEYKKLEKQETELQEDFKPVEKKKPATKQEVPPEVEDWVASNPWFDEDPELQAAAVAFHGAYGKRNPKAPLAENLKKTAEHIKRIFPEKFASENRRKSSSVEGNRFKNINTGEKKKKAAVDLPEEAKRAGERFIRQGLYKNLEEYAKDYFEE